MAYDDLYDDRWTLTTAEKVSYIKRINDHAKSIKDKFGARSPEYQAFKEAIQVGAGDYLTASGNISHGKKAIENIPDSVIIGLESRMTAAEIQKSYEEGAKQEYDTDKPTKKQIREYRKLVNTVKKMIESDPDLVSEAVRRFNLHGTQSSYQEWKNALDAIKAEIDAKEAQKRDIAEQSAIEVHNRFFGDKAQITMPSAKHLLGEKVEDDLR